MFSSTNSLNHNCLQLSSFNKIHLVTLAAHAVDALMVRERTGSEVLYAFLFLPQNVAPIVYKLKKKKKSK